MNLTGIRTDLAQILEQHLLNCRAYAYEPSKVEVPQGGVAVIVQRDPNTYVDYLQAFSGGLAEVHLILKVLAEQNRDQVPEELVDKLLSSGSTESTSVVDVLASFGSTWWNGRIRPDGAQAAGLVGQTTDSGDVQYQSVEIAVTVFVGRT